MSAILRRSGSKNACARALDAPAYCLGELSAPERDAFARHLQNCAPCAEAAAAAAQVIGWLKAAPQRECSAELTARIMSRIVADTPMPDRCSPAPFPRAGRPLAADFRRSWGGRSWLARAAGVLLLAGLGALVLIKAGRRPSGAIARQERPPETGVITAPALPAPADTATAREEALQWLARTQGADGGWESGDRGAREGYGVGVSALALQALMNGDPAALRGPHAAAIRRGIGHLIARQNANGLFGPECSGAPYNQGLATLALLDACAMESNATWRASAERAVGLLLTLQDTSGGWSYLRGGSGAVNTSASIWPLVALIRADGLGFRGVQPHVERGLMWLHSTVDPEGLMGYHRAGESPAGHKTLTAAGAVCFLKAKDANEHGIARLMLPAIRNAAAQRGKPMDYYELFFITEALALARDESAAGWLASVGGKLLTVQKRGGLDAGSWAAIDPWSDIGGPVYSTAMAALALRWN